MKAGRRGTFCCAVKRKIHAVAWIFKQHSDLCELNINLDVEQEVHHIAIFYNVLFAF